METKKKKVELKCDWCNLVFKKYFSMVKPYKRHFCSKHCRAKYTGDKLSKSLEYKESQRQLIKSKGNKPPLHEGENHWNWKGGISKESRGQDYFYIQWRKDVLAKDSFICQICGKKGGDLSAHHIKSWSSFPSLRYDIANGLCLHYDCHMKLHGLGKGTSWKPKRR